MTRTLITEALDIIIHDNKLVRLAFLTSFCHTIIIVLLLVLNLNNLIVARFEKWVPLGQAIEFILQRSSTHNVTSILIITIVVLIIGYAIVYPIGEAALIFYLKDKKYSISNAIGNGMNTFFPMFELSALAGSFSITSYILIIIRVFMLDIANSVFIQILLGIWGFFIIIVALSRPYTKFCIVMEWLTVADAIKRSIWLSLRYFWTTAKFVILEMLLIIRFLINVLVIVGIPIIMLYIANAVNILNANIVGTIIAITVIILILITTYINGIIEAFFIAYRYKWFNRILEKERV